MSGDQAVSGVYLSSTEKESGESYAEIGPNNELRVELTSLNRKATTIVDDVFTISTTNNHSRVWIEHDAETQVTFYRMDTGETIGGEANRVRLDRGETVYVGLKVISERDRVILTEIRIRAEVVTTRVSPPPTATTGTTVTQSLDTATETPAPTTGTDSLIPSATATQPTTTDGETPTTTQTPTDSPTNTSGTTTDGTPPANATTVPANVDPNATLTAAPPAVTPPVTAQEETPSPTEGVTVSTPDDVEVGGLSLVQLGGLLGLLASLAALLAAWRFFAGAPAVTFLTGAESGLTVAPADPDAEWYDSVENGFDFRLTETDTWRDATGEGVSFGGVATVTNTGADTMLVSASVEGELPEGARLTVASKERDLLTEPVELATGETITVSLDLPSDFDPGDVTIRFGERLER